MKYKFKVYDKKENKIYQVHAIEFIDILEGRAGYLVRENNQSRWIEEKDGELLLCTAIKDINGVDIYEGDIIKVKKWGKWISGYTVRLGQYYNGGEYEYADTGNGFYLTYILPNGKEDIDSRPMTNIYDSSKELEIIGNIYTNNK